LYIYHAEGTVKPIVFGTLSLALCFLPAFAQTKMASGKMAGPMSEQAFVDFAGQTDMTEAHLGQLAQEQASAQAVKDYGQMLNTDHTQDYSVLSTAAASAGVQVPKGTDKKHDEMIASLAKLKATAFDHRFLHEMVVGHEGAIAEYNRYIRDGQNAALKTYATNVLPVLQKHLDDAKKLESAKTK
jgi:putative membrane protein